MANPNIVNVANIYGKVTGLAVTTSATAIVTNASGSGKILKINSLIVSNVNGTSAADITVDVYKNQTTSYRLAFTITVPADATLVVISKDTSIYLEENDSIRLTASANSALEAVCSYEEIS
jgi:uncharacterized protein YjdB